MLRFRCSIVQVKDVVSPTCGPGIAELTLPDGGAGTTFDYVMSAEDLTFGARVANYSVEYQAAGSSVWRVLVPPVLPPNTTTTGGANIPSSHAHRKRTDAAAA